MKDKIKKLLQDEVMKKIVKKLLRRILIGAIVAVLAGACAFAVISGILDAIGKVVDGVKSLFSTPDSSTGIYDVSEGINITDDKLDDILKVIEENGLTVEDLFFGGDTRNLDENSEQYKKEVRKYLKQFLRADLCSEYPDFGITEDETHYNGIIKIKRLESTNTDVSQAVSMTYIEQSKLQAMVNSINGSGETVDGYTTDQIRDKVRLLYSIDGDGNLYFVNQVETTITDEGTTTTTYAATMQSINYRSVVEKYGMPIEASLALCEATQSPQYVYDFIEKFVLSGHIDITIMDNLYVDTYNSWYDYQITERVVVEEKDDTSGEWETTQDYEHYLPFKDQHHYTRVIKTMQSSAQITDVDTWMAKVNVTYNNQNSTEYPLGQEQVVNEDLDLPDPLPETKATSSSSTRVKKYYSYNSKKDKNNWCNWTQDENLKYNAWKRTKSEVDETAIAEKAKNIVRQWDEYFRIPNDNKREKPGLKIMDNQEMFLEFLNKEKTQKQREIYQYLIYIYTNGEYGVDSISYEMYNLSEFNNATIASSNLLKQYIRYFEHKSTPPTNADGTKYIIETDGSGHPTVGYGIDIENSGYKDEFIMAGYPTTVGGEVDIEFVDALEDRKISSTLNSIKALTGGLNLTEYQLNALVSRAYNCGVQGAIGVLRGNPKLDFVNSYSQYWNSETDDKNAAQDKNANFSHPLYTNYMSKPITSNGQQLAGLVTRRKSEWILFQTGYYDVLNKWHSSASTGILQVANEVHNSQMSWSYSQSDLVWGNIEGAINNPKKATCCATYVSSVIYKAGYLSAEYMNSFNYNECHSLYNALERAGWKVVTSYDELEPGDIVFTNRSDKWRGHVQIYAGEGKWYNSGSTKSIQSASPSSQGSGVRARFNIALRPPA